MGKTVRGQRDGTGPHKDSYRNQHEDKSFGRRLERGEKCPKVKGK